MRARRFALDNQDGWTLDLKRVHHSRSFNPSLPPVVMVPGYGMNTFILGFHPTSRSMVEFLTAQGYEVWLANLRGQGGSRRLRGSRHIGMEELALADIPRVFDFVQEHTGSTAERLHAVGCSLGGTLLYAYLAHHRDDHPLQSVIALGAPFRWDKVHPLVRMLAVPQVLRRVPIVGIRALAKAAIPLARRWPVLASPYMNANLIDLSRADQLSRTVDNPPAKLTGQLATWIGTRDLWIAGKNVSEALAELELPVLCVVANGDGMVPPESATAVRDVVCETAVHVLAVGDDAAQFAHADLFISDLAEERVFAPMGEWLADCSAL